MSTHPKHETWLSIHHGNLDPGVENTLTSNGEVVARVTLSYRDTPTKPRRWGETKTLLESVPYCSTEPFSPLD